MFEVTVTHVSGATFDVTVANMSGATAFPAFLTPTAWAVHDATASLFALNAPASAGLESLAEDGDGSTLVSELDAAAGVMSAGSEGAAPIMSGGSYSFQVTADASHRFLSIATMVVPSNDTFLALGEGGVALLDASGNARSDAEIASDVDKMLAAYDAGTEANQGGALGPDMAPHQAGPNMGMPEGDGTVRPVSDAWFYPAASNLVRVTLITQ